VSEQNLHIDISSILRQRLPHQYKLIPHFVVKWIEHTIHQDELNQIMGEIGDKKNTEAADIALRHFHIKLNVEGDDNIPADGRFIFASNHPLGGLDGLALISLLGHRYNDNIRFIVNDLLMAFTPEKEIFMPVNKFGRQSRGNVSEIEDEYKSDKQMITFPAGLCSRMQPGGTIKDVAWHKFLITSAIKDHRDIIPVFFEGENSKFFYRLAKIRSRLKVKFNVEMIYLPNEMFKCRNRIFTVHFGRPVSWASL
jgi:putative hemolysin